MKWQHIGTVYISRVKWFREGMKEASKFIWIYYLNNLILLGKIDIVMQRQKWEMKFQDGDTEGA